MTKEKEPMTAEKYLQSLEICPTKPWFDPNTKYYTVKAETIDRFAEEYAAQQKPKWISVEDELPEMGTSVLIFQKREYRNGWEVSTGSLDENCHFWTDLYLSEDESLIVTHWMPLPESHKD